MTEDIAWAAFPSPAVLDKSCGVNQYHSASVLLSALHRGTAERFMIATLVTARHTIK